MNEIPKVIKGSVNHPTAQVINIIELIPKETNES